MKSVNKENNSDLLNREEIEELLDNLQRNIEEEKQVKKFGHECEFFKNNECVGTGYGSGCKVCKTSGKRDKNNGLPPRFSEEFEEYSRDAADVFMNFHKKCDLAYNDKLCKYKNVFGFCVYCDRVFNRCK